MSATSDPLRPVFVLGLALAAPALAHAQAAAGAETKPPSTWRFSLSADGTWNENPYFLGATSDVGSAWSSSGTATLGHVRRFRTGSFSLSGFGGVFYYPQLEELNQGTYGGALAVDWSASRRTKLHLGQTYSRSNTRYLQALDAVSVPLPTTGLDNAVTTAGLTSRVSQHWQLALNGSYTWRRYDDELFADGQDLFATAQLGHQLGRDGMLYLAYGYSASWLGGDLGGDGVVGGPQRAHQVLLGGRKDAERGVAFELAGGAGYLESTGSFYPSGRAGLTARGRRSSLALSYHRDFGQAFGYGRQMIGDLASATLGWTPVRPVTFSAGYNFGYRRDPLDEAYTIRSHIASATFGWQVGGGVGFGTMFAWERNETTGQPLVEGIRVTASLTYGVDWH